MDDVDLISLRDELGVSVEDATERLPDHLWDAAVAAAVNPDTPAIDADLVPYSDDTITGDEFSGTDVDAGALVDADLTDHLNDAGGCNADALGLHHEGFDSLGPDDIDLGVDGF